MRRDPEPPEGRVSRVALARVTYPAECSSAGTATGCGCSGAGNLAAAVARGFLRTCSVIAEMATANRTWGEVRIAAEPRLKRGMSISARIVRRYMPRPSPSRSGSRGQSCSTFVCNHGPEVLACDFFASVTMALRIAFVFLVLDVGTRRTVHWNVTNHPTAEWTCSSSAPTSA